MLCCGERDAEPSSGVVRTTGLSLAALRLLRDEATALRDWQEELTTGDVLVDLVLPRVLQDAEYRMEKIRTYADLLAARQIREEQDGSLHGGGTGVATKGTPPQPPPRRLPPIQTTVDLATVGVATVYVIHTWGSSFADTVIALESAGMPADFFCIDVFCERTKVLIGSRRVSVNFLTGAFEQRIARVGRSLLVLAPWDPAMLLRYSRAQLSVCCRLVDKPAFESALLNNFAGIAAQVARLSLDDLSASDTRQREAIIETLRASHGSLWQGSTRIASAVRHALAEHAAFSAGTEEGRRLVVLGKAQQSAERREVQVGRGAGSAVLGFVTRWLGAPVGLVEAEVVARAALATREVTLGARATDTLVAVNHLAMVLASLGRLTQAEVLYRRSLLAKETAHGVESLGSAYNLASVLTRKNTSGAVRESEGLLRRVLDGRQKGVGAAHPLSLQACHALAGAVLQRAELEERVSAAKLEEAARLLRRPRLDESARSAAKRCAQDKLTEAEHLHILTLAARERTLGSAHRETLASVHALGVCARKLGRLEGAESLLARALEGREALLGAEHAETLASLTALAGVKFTRASVREAELLNRRALDGRRRALGTEHPETLATLENLAAALLASGELAAAEKCMREATAGQAKLARVLVRQGGGPWLEEAQLLLGQAAQTYDARLGREHTLTLHVHHEQALALLALGRPEEASRPLRRALYGRERQFGSEHADTLASAAALAEALGRTGNAVAAEALLSRVYDALLRLHGPMNEAVVESALQLARLQLQMRELEGARAHFQAALQGTLASKGEDHADAEAIEVELAEVKALQAKGRGQCGDAGANHALQAGGRTQPHGGVLRERAAATAPPEGGAAWLATMMLVFATMLLLLSRAVTGAVSRGGEQHAKTPLKATKTTTTMLLPAATAVCALAAARCCPLETPLKATKATKATTTMLLPTAAAACALGAAARGGGPHTETPLKATKATKTMLLPAAATAGLRRPRRGRGGAVFGLALPGPHLNGPNASIGPIEAKLNTVKPIRGIVIGAFGEVSADTHSLVKEIAAQGGRKMYALMGVSPMEAAARIEKQLIDTIGTIAARGHAQLLLARLSTLAPIAAQRGNTTNSYQQIISLNGLARAHYRRSTGTRAGAQASAAD
ncbi:hypothetical protein T492DRAFT_870822 [Pavlovales sp. CCMP2436]|nr:hypothetical protein T492DRAFT_870822 [Pavlovales sp. CCMP2436]